MNRWVLEVRRSIVAVLPMDRWVLEVRRSIAAVLQMDRWVFVYQTVWLTDLIVTFRSL